MIRFILSVTNNIGSGADITHFETIDISAHELEKALCRGYTGYGGEGVSTKHNIVTIVGAEILPDKDGLK